MPMLCPELTLDSGALNVKRRGTATRCQGLARLAFEPLAPRK